MLRIKLPNGDLQLKPGTKISLDLRNPAFETDVLQGGFSYSFSFELTDNNRVLLGFPDRVDLFAGFDRDFACVIESGSIQIEGKLRVRKVVGKEVQANVFTLASIFADDLKNTMLNQVPVGGATIELTRPFLVLDLQFRNTPTIDTRIIGTLRFYDGPTLEKEIIYKCRWKGSVALTLQNLVQRINERNRISDYSTTAVYSEYDIFLRPGDGQPFQVEPGFTGLTGKPLVAPEFLLGTVYSEGDIVKDPLGGPADFYLALADNEDEPLSNTAVWLLRDSYYWVNIWSPSYRNDWIGADPTAHPKADLYDDPDDDYRIEASYEAPYAVLRDTLMGTRGKMDEFESFTDYNACWAGTTCDFLWIIEEIFEATEQGYMLRRGQDIAAFMKARSEVDPTSETADICFPMILNEEYNPRSRGRYLNFLNYYINDHYVTNAYIFDMDNAVRFTDNLHVSAQVYLTWAVSKVFDYLGLQVNDLGVLSDDRNKKIIIYNNKADFSNSRSPDNGLSFDATSLFIDFSRHMPDISIAEFINGFRSYLFVGVFIDLFTRRVVLQSLDDVIDSAEYDDWTEFVQPRPEIDGKQAQGFRLSYGHDPADSLIGERVQNDFNGPVGEPVADLAELNAIEFAEENEIRLVLDINEYYQNQINEDLTFSWTFYSDNLQDLVIGEGRTNFQPKCSTLLMYRGTDKALAPFNNVARPFVLGENYRQGEWVFALDAPNSFRLVLADNVNEPLSNTSFFGPLQTPDYVYVPWTRQLGDVGQLRGRCTLRLLSYEGFYDTGDREIPLATSTGFAIDKANAQTGFDAALTYHGENGIYETRAKAWLKFLQRTREVNFRLRCDSVWLANLKFYRKVKIKGVGYVIKSVKLPLPHRGEIAEVVLCTEK
jgi:hypothetical protein